MKLLAFCGIQRSLAVFLRERHRALTAQHIYSHTISLRPTLTLVSNLRLILQVASPIYVF